METEEKKITVVKSKKQIIVFSIVLVALVFVFIVIFTTSVSKSKENKLHEQLDLGNKYLSDLDYEQAIASYETAIEIDPMSADAYLGLAAAYMSAGNYEKAMEILNLGYERTGNEVLLTQMQVFEEAMAFSGGADGQADGMVSGDEYVGTLFGSEGEVTFEENSGGIPEYTIDGITHRGYEYCDLKDEQKIYLDNIITLLDNGEYEDAVNAITLEDTQSIFEDIQPERGMERNFIYNDRKIYITLWEVYLPGEDVINGYNINMLILPFDTGMGYGLAVNTSNYDGSYTERKYLYGSCSEGQINWDFVCQVIEERDNSVNRYGIKGTASKGILNGDLYRFDGFSGAATVYSYNNGIYAYSDLKQNEDTSISYVGGKTVHPDGYETEYVCSYYDTDINAIRERFDSELYTIMYVIGNATYNRDDNFLPW
ncbi:MAG: tetratricopeptide repeat protein [Lachnospiraceae bacterium]|nr:tetratricopeptide repeat protein [Lachnospiraceae bacterium]